MAHDRKERKRTPLRAPELAVRPAVVSQQNCLPAIGLTPRQFCDLLLANPKIPRVCLGRLRLVQTDDLLGFLVGRTTSGEVVEHVEGPVSVADGLRRMGFELVKGTNDGE